MVHGIFQETMPFVAVRGGHYNFFFISDAIGAALTSRTSFRSNIANCVVETGRAAADRCGDCSMFLSGINTALLRPLPIEDGRSFGVECILHTLTKWQYYSAPIESGRRRHVGPF